MSRTHACPSRSFTHTPYAASAAPTSITVTASCPGLKAMGTSFTIPLSTDPKDSVLAVASASVRLADVGASD